MENNMAKVYSSLQQALKEKEFGMKVKELNGMMKIMRNTRRMKKKITMHIEMKIEI
jgi:hypothetical protein